MATQHITQLVDDIDGRVLEGGETVTFSLDGTAYEIDLSEQNASTLRDAIAPFIAAGRRVSAAPRATTRNHTSRGRASGGRDLAAIRDWAGKNGYEVSSRGRISASVLEAYDAAQ